VTTPQPRSSVLATLTEPQKRMLTAVVRKGEEGYHVHGASLRVARALEAKGLVSVRAGGSGTPYSGRWWWEAVPR
jgi:uncharacterized protein YjhX (UPF0386 family)